MQFKLFQVAPSPFCKSHKALTKQGKAIDPRELNALINKYSKEPEALQIGSPYRVREYALARIKGKTPEQALAIAKKGPSTKTLTKQSKGGFTGKREDSMGRERCYNEGKLVPCTTNEEAAPQEGGQQEQGQQEGKEEQLTPWGNNAPPPHGEKLTEPPQGVHDPDPHEVDKATGVTIAARVGVPGMSAPPPPKEIPRLPNLTEKEREVESRFARIFLKDPDAVAKEYRNRLAAGKVGDAPNIFGTDDAKCLSPDYNPAGVSEDNVKNARGIYNAMVHQTANAIAKRAFLQHLDELPEDKKTVLVTSGGCAAGKGYALTKIPEAANLVGEAGAVWDAAGEQNATENPWVLEECKKRGIKCVFVYVYANPEDRWANPKSGVIERAGKVGRMVDARLYADSHAIGAKNFQAFHEKNQDDPDCAFFVLNNATGGEPRREEKVPEAALKMDSEQLYAKALGVIREQAAKVKPAVLRGGTVGARCWGEPEPQPKQEQPQPTKSMPNQNAKGGFTGEKEDKLGRRRCYKDGKLVPCNKEPTQQPISPKTGPSPMATNKPVQPAPEANQPSIEELENNSTQLLKQLGSDLHPEIRIDVLGEMERDEIKENIVEAIVSKMEEIPQKEMDAFSEEYPGDWHRYEAKSKERIVDTLLDTWATTSADGDVLARSIQGVVNSLFDLDNAYKSYDEKPKHFAVIASFVKAVYAHTQEGLEAADITHLDLVRGFIDETVPTEGEHDVQMQPLSSYTTSTEIASLFAKQDKKGARLLYCKVPKERIFSTAFTGMGCATEGEVIVLGGVVKQSIGKPLKLDRTPEW